MPFVCTPRVLNSNEGRVSVQITDLFPHKTQSNAVYTPNFQGPQYLYAHGRELTKDVALDVNFATTAEFEGLAVYLLTTVEDDAGGSIAITAGMANDSADAIILRMESGLSLTKSDINYIITAQTGGANGIDVGNSTATVLEILQIVSGYKTYTVDVGTDVQNGGAFVALNANDQAINFSTPYDSSKLLTSFSSSFYLSARKGQLKTAQTRKDSNGNPAPLAVIYAETGTLIQ